MESQAIKELTERKQELIVELRSYEKNIKHVKSKELDPSHVPTGCFISVSSIVTLSCLFQSSRYSDFMYFGAESR